MAPITTTTMSFLSDTYYVVSQEPTVGRGNIDDKGLSDFINRIGRTSPPPANSRDFRENINPNIAYIREIHGDDTAEMATEANLRGKEQKKRQDEERKALIARHTRLNRLIDFVTLKALFKKGKGLFRYSAPEPTLLADDTDNQIIFGKSPTQDPA